MLIRKQRTIMQKWAFKEYSNDFHAHCLHYYCILYLWTTTWAQKTTIMATVTKLCFSSRHLPRKTKDLRITERIRLQGNTYKTIHVTWIGNNTIS